jgi:hypothetical protein
MKLDDNLSEVFDLAPMPKPELTISDNVQEHDEKIESDYEVTRANLRSLLVTGQEALMQALEVAKQSEHPRAFEVVGNLMKQLADVNQQLMDLHQQKQKLDEPSKAEKAKQVTNNAIFVGSTTELNKLIKTMTKGDTNGITIK